MASCAPPSLGIDSLQRTAGPRKDEYDLAVPSFQEDAEPDNHKDGFNSTPADAAQMRRMGKDQQLVRRFRLLSMASFVAVASASWEMGIFNLSWALTNGGRPVLVYSLMWHFVGFIPVNLSMAEMASMAPIAGAQYHWVSEFAPESLQRSLSYATGWTSTLAWQAGNAGGVFIGGTIIQILISLYDETYPFTQWHTTLLAIAAISIAFLANTLGSRWLHLWQSSFALHLLVYLALIIPIWVNAPKSSHHQVWSEFEYNGGWANTAVAAFIGSITTIGPQMGADTAAHMSEEVKNSSKAVPRSMIAVWLINTMMAVVTYTTIAYHLPNMEEALADPSLYPIMHIIRHTMSREWMTVLLVFIFILIICSNTTYLAAVSRDIWAFARDDGLPFSKWLSRVDQKRHIPRNSIILTSSVSLLLSLIYIGSPTAFFAIGSLYNVALLQCYCLSIGCVLWRRIKYPETLPSAEFSLGRLGIPLNIMAVAWSFFCFFWGFWPMSTPVDVEIFNWSSVLFVGTLILASIHYVLVARHKYFGPVTHVEGRKVRTS
ncbi:hypothetical protein FQN54_005952 [Arachnomyces sp. PD_36]|nr:hypothetical protein FQN54_005952 [Arachnomyces sp. PD_36]